MRTVYRSFINRKPSNFGQFEVIDSCGIQTDWTTSEEFLSKSVVCGCGSEKLSIYASSNDNINLAPVILECPDCSYRSTIFNPEKHGWDGQIGENCSLIGESEPKLQNDLPATIVAEYSYQGEESYQDIIEDGISNPEDYFDVFAVYFVNSEGNLVEVVSYECA